MMATASAIADSQSQSDLRMKPIAAIYGHLALEAVEKLRENPSNSSAMSQLAADATAEPLDEARLIAVAHALSKDVTVLDAPGATPIIEAMIGVSWSFLSAETVEAFVRFLSLLASGIPRWWSEIANNVVSRLGDLPPEQCEAYHRVISHILQLVPTSATRFATIFNDNFPSAWDATETTSNFTLNMLRIADDHQELQRAAWSLLVQRLVQLDVRCAVVKDEEDDPEEDISSSEANRVEDDEADSADMDCTISDQPPTKRRRLEVEDGEEITYAELSKLTESNTDSASEKVDAILCILFKHADMHFTPEKLESGEATPLFILLLEEFKEFVLPTHTTHASQFLMFHVAHAHTDLLDAFLVALIDIALNPTQPPELRQKAMQYIASFVARARGLTSAQVAFVTSFLASWVKRYLAERESEVDTSSSMARFRIFYAAVQALFYIFCFRHSILRKPGESGAWVAGVDKLFQRLVTSRFNPLKYCKSTVVAMFARIARTEDVAYCFSVMEQNRIGRFRASSPMPSTPSSLQGSQKSEPKSGPKSGELGRLSSVLWPNYKDFSTLESFFPFDPLSLPSAKEFIADQYVEWADVAESDSDSFSSGDEDDSLDSNSDSAVDMRSDTELSSDSE